MQLIYTKKSISCKIVVIPQQRVLLDATMNAFADASNYVYQYGRSHIIHQQWALHQACYQTVRRKFGLPANLAIRAIARAAAELGRLRYAVPVFAPNQITFDSRTFVLHEVDWSVGITLLNGREKFHMDIGTHQKNLLKNLRPASAVLVKRYKSYYLEIRGSDGR
jgi:putative transposase